MITSPSPSPRFRKHGGIYDLFIEADLDPGTTPDDVGHLHETVILMATDPTDDSVSNQVGTVRSLVLPHGTSSSPEALPRLGELDEPAHAELTQHLATALASASGPSAIRIITAAEIDGEHGTPDVLAWALHHYAALANSLGPTTVITINPSTVPSPEEPHWLLTTAAAATGFEPATAGGRVSVLTGQHART